MSCDTDFQSDSRWYRPRDFSHSLGHERPLSPTHKRIWLVFENPQTSLAIYIARYKGGMIVESEGAPDYSVPD